MSERQVRRISLNRPADNDQIGLVVPFREPEDVEVHRLGDKRAAVKTRPNGKKTRSRDSNRLDPWEFFTRFLREPRDLFLPLLFSIAPEIKDGLRECFGFAWGTWPYRILSILAEHGPCNLRMIAENLFSVKDGEEAHRRLRTKGLRLTLDRLLKAGYIVRKRELGPGHFYGIAERYRLLEVVLKIPPGKRHSMRLWFPSKDRHHKSIENRQQKLEETKRFIMDLADEDEKGLTATLGEGVSINSHRELVPEDVTVIETFSSELNNEKAAKLLDHAKQLKDSLNQESVLLEIDGKRYFV